MDIGARPEGGRHEGPQWVGERTLVRLLVNAIQLSGEGTAILRALILTDQGQTVVKAIHPSVQHFFEVKDAGRPRDGKEPLVVSDFTFRTGNDFIGPERWKQLYSGHADTVNLASPVQSPPTNLRSLNSSTKLCGFRVVTV